MHILYIDWPCFGREHTLEAFSNLGYTYDLFFHSDFQKRKSPSFTTEFERFVGNTAYDCCFSYNYFPVVSEVCKKLHMKYISFVYDSPYVMLYSYTIINPNNYVFIFDKQEYLYFKNNHIPTVYYMPLPANTTSMKRLINPSVNCNKFRSDISFVGSLYDEDHDFFHRLSGINEYTDGYLHGIMDAQLQIHGYNFIEELLTPDILTELQKSVPYEDDFSGVESPQYIYANYFINRKLTAMERRTLLTLIAEHFPLDLYTRDPKVVIAGVRNLGTVDYYTEMPLVFANSKINLNITLRSIKSGIPLRAMDILGAGGFLLTNYQEDFLDTFIPDEDFVYYESKEDLLEKIAYYLSHDTLRREIAHNGFQKAKEYHSYNICFSNIFSTVFSDS